MRRLIEKANRAAYVCASLVVIGLVWIVSFGLFQEAGAAGAAWVLAFLLGPFVCVLVHELGHALLALLAGWRVLAIHVAPFTWRPSDGRLSVVGAVGGQDLGGYCAMVPNNGKATQLSFVLGVVGGPLASIILAVLAAFVAADFIDFLNPPQQPLTVTFLPDGLASIRIEPEQESWRRAITPLFGSLALQSAAAALFSLWPIQLNGVANDGALIVRALTTGMDLRNPRRWISTARAEGVHPQHWPKWISDHR